MPQIVPFVGRRRTPSRNVSRKVHAIKMGSAHHRRQPPGLNTTLPPTLTWSAHKVSRGTRQTDIAALCRSGFYHLRQIRPAIRPRTPLFRCLLPVVCQRHLRCAGEPIYIPLLIPHLLGHFSSSSMIHAYNIYRRVLHGDVKYLIECDAFSEE